METKAAGIHDWESTLTLANTLEQEVKLLKASLRALKIAETRNGSAGAFHQAATDAATAAHATMAKIVHDLKTTDGTA